LQRIYQQIRSDRTKRIVRFTTDHKDTKLLMKSLVSLARRRRHRQCQDKLILQAHSPACYKKEILEAYGVMAVEMQNTNKVKEV